MYKKLAGVECTPATVKLAKITVVLVFFCFAECAAGSCISYGHSCWGAHGKRTDATVNRIRLEDFPKGTRWFISRLLQQETDNKVPYPKEDTRNVSKNLPDVIEDNDTKNQNDLDVADYPENNPMVETLFSNPQKYFSKISPDKIRFLKFLKNTMEKEN